MIAGVNFITTPIGTDEGVDISVASYRPPLGSLVVADILKTMGVSVRLIDPSIERVKFLDSTSFNCFLNFLADAAFEDDVKYYFFSTIAGSMPLSVLLAKEIKRRKKDAVIVFGGAGASAVKKQLIDEFEEIDFLQYGEVENSLPSFIKALKENSNFHLVPNLVYRENGSTKINPPATLPESFSAPDYKSWGFNIDMPYVPIEVGRGCPLRCAFCSTANFFSKSYRILAPEIVKEQVLKIIKDVNPVAIEFVHDLFTVNQKVVREICETLIRSNISVFWTCSSHLKCYTDELLEIMGKAGCRTIIFGIETASPRMQSVIKKNVPLDKVISAAKSCSKNNICFNGSYIIGYPEESIEELNMTISQFFDLLAVKETHPTVSILSPLGGAEYFTKYCDKLVLRDTISSLTSAGTGFRQKEWELIKKYPKVFPEYYSFEALPVPVERLKLIEEFLSVSVSTIRYAIVGLRRIGYSGLDIINDWLLFVGKDKVKDISYYSNLEFYDEFVRYYMKALNEKMDKHHPEYNYLIDLVAPYSLKLESFSYSCEGDNPHSLFPFSINHSRVSIENMPIHFAPEDPFPESSIKDVSYITFLKETSLETIEVDQRVGRLFEMCNGKKSRRELFIVFKNIYSDATYSLFEMILGILFEEGLVGEN